MDLIRPPQERNTSEHLAEDVAYVRKEKQHDDAMQKALLEAYGNESIQRGDNGYRRLPKGWKCDTCGFVNYESRWVCGECVRPASSQVGSRGGGGSSSSSSSSSSADSAAAFKPVPLLTPTSTDRNVTFVTPSGGRCYRQVTQLSAATSSKRKRAKERKTAAAAAAAVGGPPPKKSGNRDGGGGADDDDDDEPVCGDDEPVCSKAENHDDDGSDDDESDDSNSDGTTTYCSGDGVTHYDEALQQFVASMYVPPSLLPLLIGKGGSHLATLQKETSTIIMTPVSKSNSNKAGSGSSSCSTDEIIIRSPERVAIEAAVARIEQFVQENKTKVRMTHFISIPLGKIDAIRSATRTLMADKIMPLLRPSTRDATSSSGGSASGSMDARGGVGGGDNDDDDDDDDGDNNNNGGGDSSNDTNNAPSRAPTTDVVMRPDDACWIHLTMLPLKLVTREDVATAKRLMTTSVRDAIKECFFAAGDTRGSGVSSSSSSSSSAAPPPKTTTIELRGATVMNEKVEKARVVYLKVLPGTPCSEALVKLSQRLRSIFFDAVLCDKHEAHREIKLHATILNASWASANKTRNKPFDATQILEAVRAVSVGGGGGDGEGRAEASVLTHLELNKTNGGADRSTRSFYEAIAQEPIQQ